MKIYLACPYTNTENSSFIKANRAAAKLMLDGNIVFSPISMSHPIATQCDLPGDWEFWKKFDEAFIEWCDEMHVLCLPGWKESRGVTAEIKIAEDMGKPVKFIDTYHQGKP